MSSATSLTLDTPAQTTPNTAIMLTGTYLGNPQGLDYNFGAGWVQAASVTFLNGTIVFSVPAGIGRRIVHASDPRPRCAVGRRHRWGFCCQFLDAVQACDVPGCGRGVRVQCE